jgi:hypothetical protein
LDEFRNLDMKEKNNPIERDADEALSLITQTKALVKIVSNFFEEKPTDKGLGFITKQLRNPNTYRPFKEIDGLIRDKAWNTFTQKWEPRLPNDVRGSEKNLVIRDMVIQKKKQPPYCNLMQKPTSTKPRREK